MSTIDLRQGDAFELLATIPDESIDLVITDPPYESLEKHRAKGTTTRLKVSDASSNPWFPVMPNGKFVPLMRELYRVLKKGSHCYVFCDGETSDVLRDVIRFQNEQTPRDSFTWWKRIVWDKMKIGMGYHYRSRHEFIVFLEKGKRKLNDLGVPDVLQCERVRNGYPTEKPVPLLRTLIMQSSKEGDTILDPFMGSGSTGVAAHNELRSFIGFDISQRAHECASSRMLVPGFNAPESQQQLPEQSQGQQDTPLVQ